MTAATAADYLDCSVRQVQRLCKQGVLDATRPSHGPWRGPWQIKYPSVRRYRRKRLKRDLA